MRRRTKAGGRCRWVGWARERARALKKEARTHTRTKDDDCGSAGRQSSVVIGYWVTIGNGMVSINPIQGH